MSRFRPLLSLRPLLLVDAATCLAMGALLTLAAGPLGRLTALPATLLFYAGLGLVPVALFMAVVGTRRTVHPAAARLVVLGNVGWVAGSLLLLAAGWVAPNTLGVAFLLIQALAVALLALLEQGALHIAAKAQPSGQVAR